MSSRYSELLFLILTVLLLTVSTPAFASTNPYHIEISKASQELAVHDGDNIIKTFRIALGKGGNGSKRHMGDNKTPIGHYKVVEFNMESKFHFFMQINYPNILDAWYGYKDDLISSTEFKSIAEAYANNQLPPQDTALGGHIGLHGIGDMTPEKLDIHAKHNWTDGCIALKNEEISELRNYITIGTRVLIRE